MTKESPQSVVAQRIGGGVLRTTSPQASLWEAILPGELAMVDRLLDDPVFIQPFRAHFDPVAGPRSRSTPTCG
jgi:transposase, IS5 family